MKVNAFFQCFSHLAKTFFPLFGTVILYAVIGMSFFSGHLESRCRLTKEPDMIKGEWLIETENELPCGYLNCPHETYCGNPTDYGLPTNSSEYHSEALYFGYANFNNFQSSLFTVYSFFMVTGWIGTTQMYWRAQDKSISSIFFVSLVLILSQLFSNIILATLYEGFLNQTQIKHGPQDYHEKKKNQNKKIKKNKESTKKEITPDQNSPIQQYPSPKQSDKEQQNDQPKQQNDQQSPRNRQTSIDKDICDTEYPLTDEPQFNIIYHSRADQDRNQNKKKRCSCKEFFINIKNSPFTNLLFFANNLMSIIILSLDKYFFIQLIFKLIFKLFNISYSLSENGYIQLNILDFVVVVILFFEILITFFAQGTELYFSNNVNILDLLIFLAHIVSYIIELNKGEDIFNPISEYFIFIRCTKIMRSFQLLYNYKLFESMRIILDTYYFTLQTIPEYFIVIVVLVIVLTQIGRELFAQVIPHDDHKLVEEMRINFDTIQDSIIASILIFYNEEWHVSMYQYTSIVGAKSIVFYLLSILICQVLFMRLFIALFINHFMHWLEEIEVQHQQSLQQPHQVINILRLTKKIFVKFINLICIRFNKKKEKQAISIQIYPVNLQQENKKDTNQQNQNKLDNLNPIQKEDIQKSNISSQTPSINNIQEKDQKSQDINKSRKQSCNISQVKEKEIQNDENQLEFRKPIYKPRKSFLDSNRQPTLLGFNIQKDVRRLSFRKNDEKSEDQDIYISPLNNNKQIKNKIQNLIDETQSQTFYQNEVKVQSLEDLYRKNNKPQLQNMFKNTNDEDYFNQTLPINTNSSCLEKPSPNSNQEKQVIQNLFNSKNDKTQFKQKINFNFKMILKKPQNNVLKKNEDNQIDQQNEEQELKLEEQYTNQYLAKNRSSIKSQQQETYNDKNNEQEQIGNESNGQTKEDNLILKDNYIEISDDEDIQIDQEDQFKANGFVHQTPQYDENINYLNSNLYVKQNSDIPYNQKEEKEITQNENKTESNQNNLQVKYSQNILIPKINEKQEDSIQVFDSSVEKNDQVSVQQQSNIYCQKDNLSPQNSIVNNIKYEVDNFDDSNSFSYSCQLLVENPYFDDVIIVTTVILAALLVWDSPFLYTKGKEKLAIKIIQGILSFFFIILNVIRIIAYGFLFNGINSYLLRNYYNFLDFITSFTCFIYVFDLSKEAHYYLKIINIFRILLLVAYLSKKVEQIQFAGKLVLYCAPRMIRLIIFAIMYLFINGIITTKLLKGQSWFCVSESGEHIKSIIQTKADCLDLGGDWIESLYNFDNIISSIQILYNVQSSEGWLKIMFDTFDSSSINEVPTFRKHSLWAIFYIQFFFIAFICFLNMFVGLVVESYQELEEKVASTHSLNPQQKEWYFIKKSIYILSPQKKVQPPQDKLGNFIFNNLIEGNRLKIIFYLFILLNIVSFFFYSNRQSREDVEKLCKQVIFFNFSYYLPYQLFFIYLKIQKVLVNKICLIVFLIEVLLKMFVLRVQFFLYKRNIFDIIVLIIGWINLYQLLDNKVSIFDSYYRIFDGIAKGLQTFRFYRIIRHFLIIRKLFKSLHYAILSIKGILLILIIFLYTSVLLSLNLFPFIKSQSTINEYDTNFRTFFQSLFSLIRIFTSEQWYFIPLECAQKQQPNFVCNDTMYSYDDYIEYGLNGCGNESSFFFFYIFYLIFTLIILNIFIATIIESYKQAFNADESAINHYQLDDILKLWTQFDPEGKGYINYKQFWQFSSQIAIIYGVDSKELLDIKNKQKFLQTLDIPIFEDPEDKIFCYKFHDVVIQLSKVSVSIKYGVNDLEPDDDNLATLLEQNIKRSKLKGEKHIKATNFTSADMILIILLTRKVREWKKKFVEKEKETQTFSNLKNITMRLQSTQTFKKNDDSKEILNNNSKNITYEQPRPSKFKNN